MATIKENRLIYRTMTTAERLQYEKAQNASKPKSIQQPAQVDRRTQDYVRPTTPLAPTAGADFQNPNFGKETEETIYKAGGLRPSDVTTATRKEAGAPLVDPRSGIQGRPPQGTEPTGDSMGEIEKSARERLADNTYDLTGEKRTPITGDAADKKITEQKGKAQQTMSLTGQGVQYDAKGNPIAGSGKLSKGKFTQEDYDALQVKRQADTDNIVIKKLVEKKNADGSTSFVNVVDEGATTQAKLDKQKADQEEDAARAEAARANAAAGKPVPSLDAFLSMIPEEFQDQAAAIYGPLFEGLKQQSDSDQEVMEEGVDLIEKLGARTFAYAKDQEDQNQLMQSLSEGFFQDVLQGQQKSADRALEMEKSAIDLQRERTDSLMERAIRDQMLTNEKNTKDQLLGLGITGGWRASRQTADVIDALSKGDRIVADLRTDQAFAGQQSTQDLREAIGTWQGNIEQAYDAYKASNLQLRMDTMTRASEIDKTVFNSTSDLMTAISSLKSDYITKRGERAATSAKYVSEQNKYLIDSAADIRKSEIDAENETWDRAMTYVEKYGTQNKDALRSYETSLGLPPGALSSQQTIEEMKMRKAATGPGAVGGVANEVADLRREINASYNGLATPEQIDNIVYSQLRNRYGDDTKGRAAMRDIETYMGNNRIGDQSYRIYNNSPSSEAGKRVLEDIETNLNDQYRLTTEEITPEELYQEIVDGYQEGKSGAAGTKSLPADQRKAIGDMEGYGYVRSDWGWGDPAFSRQ